MVFLDFSNLIFERIVKIGSMIFCCVQLKFIIPVITNENMFVD